MFLFEKLDVYQLALELYKSVAAILKTKSTKDHWHLVDQFRRAALSVSLNIAEGNGRWHKNDRRNFFLMARGSAFECVPLTALCVDQGLLTASEAEKLRADIERISKMLSGLINGPDKP